MPVACAFYLIHRMRFHCIYARNVHIDDRNKHRKWKQALQYFTAIKLPWVWCRRADTGWDFPPGVIAYTVFDSTVTPSSEKLICLEGQIIPLHHTWQRAFPNQLAFLTTAWSPLCILAGTGGLAYPESCIQRLSNSLEILPLILRGSDFIALEKT